MPRVLLLVPSTSYRARDFIDAARTLGVDVTVGSDYEPAIAGASGGRSLRVDLDDVDRAVAQVVVHAQTYPIDAVLGTDDASVFAASAAAEALGLPHNPPAAVAAARDKYRFREALMRAQIHGPGFRLVDLNDAPDAMAERLDYPCVVKPRSLSASRGVIRANSPDEFRAAWRRVAAILESVGPLPEPDHRHTALVEDYVPGAEVALEGLLDDGRLHVRALMDKPDPMEGPYFEETILVTPSRHSRARQAAIVDTVERAARALGLRYGPVHAEVRVGAYGVVVIEIAPRSIGGLCSRAIPFPGGESLESVVLRHAVEGVLPPPAPAAGRGAAGVMMIPIPRVGRLAGVEGMEAARAVPGVSDVVIAIPPGEPLVPVPEGDRYLGFIFACGNGPEAVVAALREAQRWLDIGVEI